MATGEREKKDGKPPGSRVPVRSILPGAEEKDKGKEKSGVKVGKTAPPG